MALVKIERDECQVYFVASDLNGEIYPRFATWWVANLSLTDLAEWKRAENEFWNWQNRIEHMVLQRPKKCAKQAKSDSIGRKKRQKTTKCM